MININVTPEEAPANEEKPTGNIIVREVKSWAMAFWVVFKLFMFTAFFGFAFALGALKGIEFWGMLP